MLENVLFIWTGSANHVTLRGDWKADGWDDSQDMQCLEEKNLFYTILSVRPGRLMYKYVVDG